MDIGMEIKLLIMILIKLVRYWITFCVFLILTPVVFPWYIAAEWRSVIHNFIPLLYKFQPRYSRAITDESRIRKRKAGVDAVLALYRCEYPDTSNLQECETPEAKDSQDNGVLKRPQRPGAREITFPNTDKNEQGEKEDGEEKIEVAASDEESESRPPSSATARASVEPRRVWSHSEYQVRYKWNIPLIFCLDAEFQDPLMYAQGIDEIYAAFQPIILWCTSEHLIRTINHYDQATMIQLNQKWTLPIIGSVPYMRTTIWIEFDEDSSSPSHARIRKMYDLWNDTTLLAKSRWARRLTSLALTHPILFLSDSDLFLLISRVHGWILGNLMQMGMSHVHEG
jgi:hypothetical protein